MTKNKGRVQRERGLKEISGAPEPRPEPVAEDASLDEEGERSDFPIYLSPEDRAFIRLVVDSHNRLMDFAIMQQVKIQGEWREVLRYDCAHGTVHAHMFRMGKREAVSGKHVCDLADIDVGYEAAQAAVLDGWEENRRRYFDG